MIEENTMVLNTKRQSWVKVGVSDNFTDRCFDGNDIMGNPVRFTDILKFSEKYMIVKGFMQVCKQSS